MFVADRTVTRGHRMDSWFSYPELDGNSWESHHTTWTYGHLTINRTRNPRHVLGRTANGRFFAQATTTWTINLTWTK